MPIRLGEFELRKVIGAGGMGTVYQAIDLSLQRRVAVKLIHKELIEDAQALEKFRREARAYAALNHPNIIAIHAFDDYEGAQPLDSTDRCGSRNHSADQRGAGSCHGQRSGRAIPQL